MHDLTKGRVLITGGAGFIGSALVWELNRRGIDDILVSDFLGTDEKWRNLVALRFRDYVEADDLLREMEPPGAFSEIRSVFHLGACSSTTETDASYLIRNNFEYTKKLASYALRNNWRFIYASSAATYGENAAGISEVSPLEALRPLNMYGYSKHLFDTYAQNARILNQLTGLKYFNVFGPNEYHKGDMRSVVHKAFQEVTARGTMSLFKSYRPEYQDGMQMRDFLYVKDAVAATIYLAEHVNGGGLFNIGSGQPRTWVDLAKAIFAALGLEPHIDFIEMPLHLRLKYQYFTRGCIDKLRAAGFDQEFTSLESAVADYVANYLVPACHLGESESELRLKSSQAS